jgi:hypothetical protein
VDASDKGAKFPVSIGVFVWISKFKGIPNGQDQIKGTHHQQELVQGVRHLCDVLPENRSGSR